ncbi:MAG: dihydroxy-acid dehydratase, partial [Bacteroidota bacterium]|nr:dihydroxy-acid dehydratase [Bacteroidota bacterium]
IGHCSPEAEAGGPIALVDEGDMITINLHDASVHWHVDEVEQARRRTELKPFVPSIRTGYLARYSHMVTSASTGAILRVPGLEQAAEPTPETQPTPTLAS